MVLRRVGIILDARKSAEEKLKDYLLNTDTRPDICKELFLMLNSTDELLELVSPSQTAGEFHGIPREYTVLSDEHVEFVHVEKPGWDFTAWFGEKTTHIKKAVKELTSYYEMNYASLKLASNEMTPREYVKHGIDASLYYIHDYTQTVFDQVFDDKLEIKTSQRD